MHINNEISNKQIDAVKEQKEKWKTVTFVYFTMN